MRKQETRRRVLCVLGGGRSRRFGMFGEAGHAGDSKLNVCINGLPILRWLHERLCGGCDTSWLILGPDQALPVGAEVFDSVVRDAEAYAGPMRVIESLLNMAQPTDELVIVAGDMPGVTLEYVDRLRACAYEEGTEMAVVVGQYTNGMIEPMPSVWRVHHARGVMSAALHEGVRGPSGLAGRDRVGEIVIDAIADRCVHLNINTRDDMADVSQTMGVMVRVENLL